MSETLRPGDKFTVAGVGYDKDGWLVLNGHRGDGRRSVALQDAVWTAQATPDGETLPAIIGSIPAVLPKQAKPQPRAPQGPARKRWGKA